MLNKLKLSFLSFVAVIVIGVIGYMSLENLSFEDAIYLTILTIATVGYDGNIAPHSSGGRLFTLVLITFGVGIAYYTFTLVFSLSIEGQLKGLLGRREMNKKISKLENHIIVCGAGKIGINVIERLSKEKEPFVVIESEKNKCDELIDHKYLVIHGDATLDETLIEAGLFKAKGLVTVLPNDSDNLYVTLTASTLNNELNIVSRANRIEAEEKLRRAGASTVISPAVSSGRQMVTAITKPVMLDFVQNLFYNQELNLNIAEIEVFPGSLLCNSTIADSLVKNQYNVNIIAINRNSKLISNPPADEIILEKDILIVFGKQENLDELNLVASNK